MTDSQPETVWFDSGKARCHAWFYAAQDSGSDPGPCIVMAHGLGGTKTCGLQAYAERFRAAGFHVLLFDYRHFGDSEGEPRQLLSVKRELQDWRAAIAWARQRPGVDPARIGLWGTSFAGGHVLTIAARDKQLAAIVSQVPMTDGFSAVLNVVKNNGLIYLLRLTGTGILDAIRSLFGASPVRIPLAAAPGELAFMNTPDALPGYRAIAPDDWRNEACARLALTVGMYRPIAHTGRIQCPAYFLISTTDSVAPSQAAMRAARRLGDLAEVHETSGGHFDVYTGDELAQWSADQSRFFREHL